MMTLAFGSYNLLPEVSRLQNVVAISPAKGAIFSIYHVTSKDHIIKRPCEFMGGSSSW